MTRCSKILSTVLLVAVLALGALALVLSHTSACGTAAAVPEGAASMRAAIYRCYGPPEVVKIETVTKPTLGDHDLLVRVRASSVNPLEWHLVRGEPYIVRALVGLGAPQDVRLGTDFAGTVEAVGKLVTRFKPGDAVFGGGDGALAQYMTVRESGAVVPKPASVTFEQAAVVPVAALTALQALRDHGKIQLGQKVLINGAGGGVGTFALQLAKAFGAEVTAVTSSGNLELVRSIGADHVIDYAREDFTRGANRYDLIIDCGGGHSLWAYRRVLSPAGIYVGVGEVGMGKWIEPFIGSVTQPFLSALGKQRFTGFIAALNARDLATVGDLLDSGKVKPVIDRRYALEQTSEALRYLETGKVRGKLVVAID